MKSTFFAAAFLASAVVAAPNKGSCEGPYGKLPCGSRDAEPYIVQSGDTLTVLAGRFNSGICDIAKYNGLADPNLILVNQTLIIPNNCVPAQTDNSTCLVPVNATGTQDCVKGLAVLPSVYEVLPNDTFTKIANKFDLKLDALKAPNKAIYGPTQFNVIFPKNHTIIPICKGCDCVDTEYIVKSGDTFSAIAAKNNITVGQIEASNPGQIPEQLQIDQSIRVPVCKCTP